MKKIMVVLSFASMALMMQSCYNSAVCVGEMKKGDPAICVNTIHNHHFIYGLVGHHDIEGQSFVAGKSDYKVKNYRSFTDLLISGITSGIYTPTTTKIYLPVEKNGQKQK